MSVRSQVAAVREIRDNAVPEGASASFLDGWKAAFAAISADEKIFDLMPKAAIVVDVTPGVAKKFIEQMRSVGYESVKDSVSRDDQEYWYFRVNGETSADYEVIIRRPDRKAFIRIRPQ